MRKETANVTKTQPAEEQDLLLRVAEALSKDVGRGLVRLDPQDLERLGVEIGDIAEILLYDTALSDVQAKAVTDYLYEKYFVPNE
ncbi:hypothetical protein D4R47_00505, partial [archaeon]